MISEYMARTIHDQVLTAFDEGVRNRCLPKVDLMVEASNECYQVTAPIDAADDVARAVQRQARNLCYGIERQVTTFISDTQIGVVVSEVIEDVLGVWQFLEGNVRWRLADRRVI